LLSAFFGYPLGKSKKKLLLILSITILLLSSLPLLAIQNNVLGQTTPIFSDDFETGNFNAWTGTKSFNSGVTSSVQTSTSFSGAYAIRATVADGAGESGACVYKDLGANYNAINARVYVEISAKPAVGGVLEIFGYSGDGWLPNAVGTRVDLENDNGVVQWRLNYYNNGWQSAYAGPVNVGAWYYVEARLVIGNGIGETHLYVNGAEVITKTGLTNIAPGNSVRYFSLGIDDEVGSNTLNSFFDSVVISNAYIGPNQPSPTPTPAPSPTPSPSPTPTPTATPTPTPSPTPTPASTPTPTPTPTATPTPKPTPTPTPTPIPTLSPSSTPKPTATPTPTPTPIPSPSPTPKPTAIPIPTPTPSPTPNPTPSPLIFQDGFESGNFNAWTTTDGAGTHTQTVETTNPHHGTYDAKFTAGANSEGWAQKTIPNSPIIYFQQYIKLANLPTSGTRLYLGTIQNTNSNNNVDVFIENSSGQYYWGIYSSINGAIYNDRETTPSNPQLGQYYCVESCRDVTNSRSRLWVDGTLKVDVSRPNSGNANGIYSGITWTTNTATVYVDCIKIANSYIQPESSPPPTPTPTPTPSTTPTPIPTSPPIYKETTITKQIQASWIADDGTLYAGSGNTLYKSADQGKTWQSLLTFSGTSAGINCVFINKLNYVFVSPTSDATSLGLWRSTNAGLSWTKVSTLSPGCSIFTMAQDSNGNLFAGIYTTGSVGNATILKSTDNGAHWTTVYYDSHARHIHCVTVDLANNYIYAAVGDVRVDPNWYTYVIRATDDGAGNSSWKKIWTLPQMLSVQAIDTTDSNPTPLARIFATDYDNGQVYRTTDDVNFNLVLETGDQCYGFWIRTNNLNGNIYVSFTSGEHPTNWIAGIWVSNNNGVTWTNYKTFPVHGAYLGSGSASNFFQGTMYYSVNLDSGWQNGIRIYPDYSGSGQTQTTVSYAGSASSLSLNALLLVSAAFTFTANMVFNKSNFKLPRLR
jgi:hypothetical protein